MQHLQAILEVAKEPEYEQTCCFGAGFEPKVSVLCLAAALADRLQGFARASKYASAFRAYCNCRISFSPSAKSPAISHGHLLMQWQTSRHAWKVLWRQSLPFLKPALGPCTYVRSKVDKIHGQRWCAYSIHMGPLQCHAMPQDQLYTTALTTFGATNAMLLKRGRLQDKPFLCSI